MCDASIVVIFFNDHPLCFVFFCLYCTVLSYIKAMFRASETGYDASIVVIFYLFFFYLYCCSVWCYIKASETGLSPPPPPPASLPQPPPPLPTVLFLLTVPRQFFCCKSFFARLCFHKWHLSLSVVLICSSSLLLFVPRKGCDA